MQGRITAEAKKRAWGEKSELRVWTLGWGLESFGAGSSPVTFERSPTLLPILIILSRITPENMRKTEDTEYE